MSDIAVANAVLGSVTVSSGYFITMAAFALFISLSVALKKARLI